MVNITIPVFNEEKRLPVRFPKLHRFLLEASTFDFELVIGENGSTDQTREIANSLAQAYSHLRVVHLPLKGRGRVLKQVWSSSRADVLSYMDVDLSADLNAFPLLIQALTSGRFDVVTGSRLHQDSFTLRCWRREATSRCYNWLVRRLLATHFSDAQCGFKAITREAAERLLPEIEDPGWFFDTELLTLAEKCGYRICDLPVKWTEDPDSRVQILPTAWAGIKGLFRIRHNLQRKRYAHLLQKPCPPT